MQNNVIFSSSCIGRTSWARQFLSYVVIMHVDVKALHVHVHQSSNKSESISAKQDVTNTEIDEETEPEIVIVCLVCSHLIDHYMYIP